MINPLFSFMAKTNSILKTTTKYFKIRQPNTDNWYCGKTESPTLPKGALSISMFEYFKMAYGKAATNKAMRELKKIYGVAGRGSVEIETAQDISHLPDANSPEFQHLVN